MSIGERPTPVAAADQAGRGAVWSDRCRWDELTVPCRREWVSSGALELGEEWTKRWTARWRFDGGPVVCPVRDLGSLCVQGAQPVRRFSWRTSQRHRPGLQYMVSTGRHHGFESHAEQQLLLALDFDGGVTDVLSQPFCLKFTVAGGVAEHTPDFLAWTRTGTWLIDVRPGSLVRDEDRARFAAAAEVALSCGWRYTVVGGWRAGVQATLDTLSAGRRPVTDPLGLRPVLLAAVAEGPVAFGALVERTAVPAVARAVGLHLIWHRLLGIELSAALTDRTLVRRAAATSAERDVW